MNNNSEQVESRNEYAESFVVNLLFGPLKRFNHRNILFQADFKLLQINERQNESFIELIPFILVPEYGHSNTTLIFVRRFFHEIDAYQELFCVVTLLVNSSKHENEANEKIK